MKFNFPILIFMMIGLTVHGPLHAKPFWTEKATYEQGDRIYAVGVATRRQSVESGRRSALRSAKSEISNFIQAPIPPYVKLRTQMNFEETHEDGTVSVYRLMWIDKSDLSGRTISGKSAVRKVSPIGTSPWLIGIPLEFTGLPFSLPGSSMFVLGFGLSGERKFGSLISARVSIFYEVGVGNQQDFNGFKYGLSLPFYLSPSIFLSPDVGYANSSYTLRSTGASQAFKLRQAYFGGGLGYLFKGENLAGQIQFNLHRFAGSAGLSGKTAFLLKVGLLIDPGI